MTTITTADQLDALPIKAVLIDKGGQVVWRDLYDHWCAGNGTRRIKPDVVIADGAPLTLVYRPDAQAATPAGQEEAMSTTDEDKCGHCGKHWNVPSLARACETRHEEEK